MQSGRIVCHAVCVQDYCKSNLSISVKLGCYDWAYQSEELLVVIQCRIQTNQPDWVQWCSGRVSDS